MSIIAWDRKSIAADRQATCADMRFTTKKMLRIGEMVVAWTGVVCHGLQLVDWWRNGAIKEEWPACQADESTWARLIVVEASGRLFFYEQEPVKQEVLDDFIAFGSGRDFAMGAMAHGASAKEAVEIASRFNIECGLGVDVEILT